MTSSFARHARTISRHPRDERNRVHPGDDGIQPIPLQLKPVRQAAQHRAADAEEAVAARQTSGDVTLVGQVAGVDLKPPRAVLVADHGVEQCVIRRADGVGAVPGLADVT